MTITVRQWIGALVAAMLVHVAAFAMAARLDDDGDMARGQGAQASVVGAVSLLSSDSDSELFQEVEPSSGEAINDPVTPDDPIDPNEKSSEPDPVLSAALSETMPAEIEPIAESSIAAVAAPEADTTSLEPEPVKPLLPITEKATSKLEKKPRKKKSQSSKSRTAAVRQGGGASGRQSSASGTARLTSYKGRVRARVAGRARSPGGSGTVVVRFTVTASGGVSGASIVRGASNRLNSAALRAVRGGFPPIPAGLPRRLSFTLPIRFR